MRHIADHLWMDSSFLTYSVQMKMRSDETRSDEAMLICDLNMTFSYTYMAADQDSWHPSGRECGVHQDGFRQRIQPGLERDGETVHGDLSGPGTGVLPCPRQRSPGC